jgi:SprT protein
MITPQLARNQSILYKYIPEKAVPVVSEWIVTFDFKLKIKKSRSTKLGDYRPPYDGANHQITINHDMNKYAFLITLIHEIAHLHNFNKHKHSVKPHGEEWKMHYKLLMRQFLIPDIFPPDVIIALTNYMTNPAASSCSDINLLRVLKKYDERQSSVLLEEAKKIFFIIHESLSKLKKYENDLSASKWQQKKYIFLTL